MTYSTEAARPGKQPITYVEIDFAFSADTTEPENSLGEPSFATPSTADEDGITFGIKTRYFQSQALNPLPGRQAWPCVLSVKRTPEEIQLIKGMPIFGKVDILLQEFDSSDRLEDPFWGDATRTWPDNGPFLARLLARNPYWLERDLRIKVGYTGRIEGESGGSYDANNFKTYNYKVKQISGPNSDKMRIQAGSPLLMLSLNEKLFPEPSTGVLLEDLAQDDLAVTATITPDSSASEYGASGFVRINDEVMSYTRSGSVLTLVRARKLTTLGAHSAGDTIQECEFFGTGGVTRIDEVLEILCLAGDIDASNIPDADWADEYDTWMPSFNLIDTLITKPEKIKTIIGELLELTGSYFKWNESTSEIEWKFIRPSVGESPIPWNETEHIIGRVSRKQDISKRVSTLRVFMGLRNPTLDLDNTYNYSFQFISPTQKVGQYENKTVKVHTIYSRWLDSSQKEIASRAGQTIPNIRENGRITYTVSVNAETADGVETGDVVSLNYRDQSTTTGEPITISTFVVKKEEVKDGERFTFTLEYFPWSGRYIYLGDTTDATTYAAATDEERDPGWYLADTNGLMPNGDPGYALH